jgi:hypothetical protein
MNLEGYGSLARLLRHHAEVAGVALTIEGFDEIHVGSRFRARVGLAKRSTDIFFASDHDLLLAPLWHEGVRLGSVQTSDPSDLVRILDLWFNKQARATELAASNTSVSLDALAHAYEAGPQAYVAAVWVMLLRSGSHEPATRHQMWTAAFESPLLSLLLPFTSLSILGFSYTTGFPFEKLPVKINADSNGVFRAHDRTGQDVVFGSMAQLIAHTEALVDQSRLPARHGVARESGGG